MRLLRKIESLRRTQQRIKEAAANAAGVKGLAIAPDKVVYRLPCKDGEEPQLIELGDSELILYRIGPDGEPIEVATRAIGDEGGKGAIAPSLATDDPEPISKAEALWLEMEQERALEWLDAVGEEVEDEPDNSKDDDTWTEDEEE